MLRKSIRPFISLMLMLVLLGMLCPAAVAESKSAAAVLVDGKKINVSISADNTSLVVPADIVYKALGATCSYSASAKRLKVSYGLKTFYINKGYREFTVNAGKRIEMEAQPYYSGQHFMMPLRSIAESVGGGVKWDGNSMVWRVYGREHLEDTVDIMGDGTKLKTRLAGYEHYFYDSRNIFWSALRDGASLYRSDKDGKYEGRLLDAATEIIGLSGDYVVFINISDKNRLYRIKKDGTGLGKIAEAPVFNVKLVGDVISYFSLENGLSACSVKVDGTGRQILEKEITIMNGDWSVNENTAVTGKTILLKGNLSVNEECTLTLEDTRLVFDTGAENGKKTERRLDIKNAALNMKNCELRSTRQDNGINFSAETSVIKVESTRISNIIGNIELNRCNDIVFNDNYVIDTAESGFVDSNEVNGAVYRNNIIINKDTGTRSWITFLSGTYARNLVIQNNVCVDQGECLFFQQGTGGLVSGNLLLGDSYYLGLSLRHDAGNATYDNNFLQLNYNDGYRISAWDNSNALNSDTLECTSTFSRNVINNATNAMQIQNLRNCIYDSNRVWLQLFDKDGNRNGVSVINMRYSHDCEIINNTFESWSGGNAVQLFYSSGNCIEGNTFRGFKYGLELWDKSDGNSISGNKIIDCNSSILINTSKGNKVTGNTLGSTRSALLFAYNNGNNDWSSNYYSDWKKTGPRSLSGAGSDRSPLLAEPVLKKAKTEIQPKLSDYASRWDENKNNTGRGFITDNQLWKDKTVNYIWHDFNITDGGTLTLDNVTWRSPVMYNSEPEIYVKKGGALILKNSRIVADAEGMPFYFQIEAGGKLIAENCTFENVQELSAQGGIVTIRNCTFKDCYDAIYIGGQITAEVTGCKVINSFTGITVDDPKRCKLSGNIQTNVALSFREPK